MEIKAWTTGDNVASYIELGETGVPFTLTDSLLLKTFYITAKADSNLRVYNIANYTSKWYIDNVSIVEIPTIYIESNLLDNHTFHHSTDVSGYDVGRNNEYKINSWAHIAYQDPVLVGDTNTCLNLYGWKASTTQTKVEHIISGGGYWETSPDNINLSGKSDFASDIYPFNVDDRYMKLINEYNQPLNITFVGTVTADSTSNTLIFNNNINQYISKHDILKIESEYMEVLSVENKIAAVKRAVLDSTLAAHDGSSSPITVYKSLNHGITQTVDKNLLKKNQSYNLSFYAKDDNNGGHGAVSIEFNGGYILSDGTWTESSRDLKNGYGSNINEITQEARWIDFNLLNKPNLDISQNAGATATTNNALDNIWRKFDITFTPEINKEFLTGMRITFASRGVDASYIHIDSASLLEHSVVSYNNQESSLTSSAILDNSGKKELVSYDSIKNKLKSYSDIFTKDFTGIEKTWTLSNNASPDIKSSQKNATFVSNNREMHIGFGGDKEDTSPQWLGYINHTLFGHKYENELYQDEDTVHTYDEQGIGTLSKICLAGEYERLACSWSDPDLTINHTAHPMNIGDNIVVREWMDADNSWDGNGVWIVKTAATDSFTCVRATTYDKKPSAVAQDSKISYRPYFYYGIKDGEPSIYRIWPDTRVKSGGSGDGSLNDLDAIYTKGKIEKSLPISTGVTSICTFYNKDITNGLGGGKIYALSATSNEILVLDVMKKYDEWTTSKLIQNADIDLVFKAFKWSNSHINGDIDGSTEVFGGLASESTPTISYSGLLSDIIETKGPTNTYIHGAATSASDTILNSHFDTRLWIQSRPTGEDGFSEGDRFLFCARTQSSNTDGPDVLYCADRTPPTTVVTKTRARYSEGNNKYEAGPGKNYDDSPDGKRAYFHHYYDDDDSKNKLSRLSVIRDGNGTSNGHNGILGYAGDQPYINFGYNVGYESSEGMPSIIVAKYGLFQIADNDGDGVLDGTGVVIPSTTSIPTGSGADEAYKTGPYGRLNQRVCGHAVGLIGGTTSGSRYRHWGRMHSRMNASPTDYFISRYGDGPHEDSPEFMNIKKCIFISTDTHYGDYQPAAEYAWTASPAGATTQTDLTISHSTYDLTTLEVGDTLWLKNSSTSANDVCANVTLIDPSANIVRVNVVHTNLDATGTLRPHMIHVGMDGNKGGIVSTEIAHHWSFNEEEKNDGAIFTTGAGSGHYTKTFLTPPSYWGGAKDNVVYNEYVSPGYIWKHEKLSFRGGIMMRPFEMEDEDFANLIVGNGIYVDMPSWPNAIYHESQSSKIHYNVDNSSGYKGSFASKLFITAPIPNDTNQRSNVYICDLNFMYPDISLQDEIEMAVGPDTTNSWNDGVSWDICCAGLVDDYIEDDDAGGKNILRDAANHPVLQLGGDDFTGINSDIFGAASLYRDATNSLTGLCISVMDKDYGTIETRYIVGSEKAGDSATDDMYVSVHYPFGNTPVADDKFWIWKHSLAVTAPVRLYKTKTLGHELGDALIGDPTLIAPIYKDSGDISIANSTAICTTTSLHGLTTNDTIRLKDMTDPSYNNGVHKITVTSPTTFTSTTINDPGATIEGTWELSEDSNSSIANPLVVDLTRPLISANFGGLDMRKTKSYTIDNVVDGTDSASEQKLRADADHLLITGDTITYDAGGGDELDGTYNVDLVDADQVDITTTATDTDTGTAYTNQFELLIAGTTANSSMGELRAGFNQWDKGDVAGNIQRYDSTTDSDRFINYGESSITISPTSLGNQSGDVFFKNNRYYYKVSYIYDGYQEGPLSDSYWSHYDAQSRAKLSIKIKVKNVSRRLTHVCLYRKDNLNDFYKLVKQIDTDSGWNFDGTYYSYIFGDEGQLGPTYESRTGMSEVLDTIKLKYGMSIEIDGYMFVGDCSHSKIESASNMIFRSRPGMFSMFDYANDFLTLKSKPTALANFNGRLYVFDINNIYKVNQESLIIEDIYEGVGCLSKDSIVVTEYGMFFADKTGAYRHDGQQPIKISQSIQKGGDTESSFVTGDITDNIKDISWESVVTSVNKAPYVAYNSGMNSVLFNVEYLDTAEVHTYNLFASKRRQYIWSYNLINKRWDLWELADNAIIGKPFSGTRGEIYWPIDNAVYEHMGGADNKDYTWISKKLTMGEDSIFKVFNKIKVNGLSSNLNLDGDNTNSDNKLFIKTSSGDIGNTTNIVYSSATDTDSDYKLSGSNKKGRWIQFKIENVTENIDSFGIIFRRKSTK